jgi:hypothetical protein
MGLSPFFFEKNEVYPLFFGKKTTIVYTKTMGK